MFILSGATCIIKELLMGKLTLQLCEWVGGGWHSHTANSPHQIDDNEPWTEKQQEKDNHSYYQSLLFITNQCASKVRGGDSIVSIVDGPDLNLEKYICDQE